MNRFHIQSVCLFATFMLAASLAPAEPTATHTCALWGTDGEAWKPDGRLPDFSYAGYHRGEQPLPERKPDVSVKDFGAIGDGKTDDTAAFKRALRQAAGKVIAIPAGRYVISDILEIEDSGTVLQGAGSDKTTLYAPIPLEKIRPNMGATTSGKPTSNYSWSGGIVWAKGRMSDRELAEVTAPAKRGDTSLVVDRPDQFTEGAEIRLAMRDDRQSSLVYHLYADDPGEFDNLRGVGESWVARVVRIEPDAKRVHFDRTLRTDVRLEWRPVIHPARSTVEEVGVEHLAFEFPVSPYAGHFTELGHNAIAFSSVRNCWVRDVEIRHADSGIFISGTNNTVTGVLLASDRERNRTRGGTTGHHGITLGGTDLLLAEFNIRTKFIHDVTMSRGSAGNVIVGGKAEDLACDHHKYANHANLFCDIDAGQGSNIFYSGGGAKLGRHCGAWTTWWNIRTEKPVEFPVEWATDMINLVGVKGEKAITDSQGRWFEPLTKATNLVPTNLYKAQLNRRLN